jgi:hypothetical protein
MEDGKPGLIPNGKQMASSTGGDLLYLSALLKPRRIKNRQKAGNGLKIKTKVKLL